MDSFHMDTRFDDALVQETARSDPRLFPHDAVVKAGVFADVRSRTNGGRAGNLRVGGHLGGRLDPAGVVSGRGTGGEVDVHGEVLFPSPEIPPVAVIDNHSSERGTAFQHFEEDRDYADFHPGWHAREEARADEIDAGEKEVRGAGRVKTFTDVCDMSAGCIERDLQRAIFGSKHHGHFITGVEMRANGWLQRKVSQDVAVVYDECLVPQQILDVLDAPRGFKDFRRFVSKFNGNVTVTAIGKSCGERFRAPMGIHNEASNACLEEVIESEGDERFIGDRDERLGTLAGERLEPCAESGAKNECGGDHEARSM